MSWIEGNVEKIVTCTQAKLVSDLAIEFDWPTNTGIPEGTEVKLAYRLRRTPESYECVMTKTAIVGAPCPKDASLH